MEKCLSKKRQLLGKKNSNKKRWKKDQQPSNCEQENNCSGTPHATPAVAGHLEVNNHPCTATPTVETTSSSTFITPVKSESSKTEVKGGKKTSGASGEEGLDLSFEDIVASEVQWQTIQRENLNLAYTVLLPRHVADVLVQILEDEVEYFTGELAKVKVFGKWHDIPRKQATYGDAGLSYTYSGRKTPAQPWPRCLAAIRDLVSRVSGHNYNFVLVNRYKDGGDRMGEHRDDERELDPHTPIASLSLGQPRHFYFRHKDARPPKKRHVDKVELVLQHGSLLLMKAPTNQYWYHALPPRRTAHNLRINMTFRRVLPTRPTHILPQPGYAGGKKPEVLSDL